MNSLNLTLNSAIGTLSICYSKARKDSLKVYQFGLSVWTVLNSPKAKLVYRFIYQLTELAVLFAIAFGHTCYKAGWQLRDQLDLYVGECLEEPETEVSLDSILSAIEALEALPDKPRSASPVDGLTLDNAIARVCQVLETVCIGVSTRYSKILPVSSFFALVEGLVRPVLRWRQ